MNRQAPTDKESSADRKPQGWPAVDSRGTSSGPMDRIDSTGPRFPRHNILGWNAQFDPMAIGILDECLECSVGSGFSGEPSRAGRIQVRFPLIERIDDQGNVTTAVMRVYRHLSLSDQVEFLLLAESEPGTGKIKGGSIHDRKLHDVTVKRDAQIKIGNMQGSMVKLENTHTALTLHGNGIPGDNGSIVPYPESLIQSDYNAVG